MTMTDARYLAFALCITATSGLTAAQRPEAPLAVAKTPAETELLAADARQREAVSNADAAAIRRIAHPNFQVNAPTGQILTREQLAANVTSGEIRNDVFERIPETVIITGNVGVVMGRERVIPGVGSEQARMFGIKSLNRRYTNVYIRKGKTWLHLARHASVAP